MKVISTSYGYYEADLPPSYEMRQCNEYMKFGLMGVTVLYSSGDYGKRIPCKTHNYGKDITKTPYPPGFAEIALTILRVFGGNVFTTLRPMHRPHHQVLQQRHLWHLQPRLPRHLFLCHCSS